MGEDNEELADLLAGQGFPQVARLELDQLLEQLIERARDVQATQGRLRGLLRANLEVARAVDVDQIRRHILEAATTLVDAKYAALGVVRDGRLVRFVHAWQKAMAELATAVLNSDRDQAVSHIVRLLGSTMDNDGVSLCVPAGEEVTVAAANGLLGGWVGQTIPVAGPLYEQAIAADGPVVVADASTDPRTADRAADQAIGPCVAVPMRTDVDFNGVLFVCRRRDAAQFDPVDLEMVSTYAQHAALVLQLADARQDNELLRLAEDRR